MKGSQSNIGKTNLLYVVRFFFSFSSSSTSSRLLPDFLANCVGGGFLDRETIPDDKAQIGYFNLVSKHNQASISLSCSL
jgi:predicted metalloendopeptidase